MLVRRGRKNNKREKTPLDFRYVTSHTGNDEKQERKWGRERAGEEKRFDNFDFVLVTVLFGGLGGAVVVVLEAWCVGSAWFTGLAIRVLARRVIRVVETRNAFDAMPADIWMPGHFTFAFDAVPTREALRALFTMTILAIWGIGMVVAMVAIDTRYAVATILRGRTFFFTTMAERGNRLYAYKDIGDKGETVGA